MNSQTKYRVCPVCEATCGLELEVKDEQVIGIRGNKDDLISLGHVCPKGVALMEIRDDPDRLKTPMVRKNGELQPASWEEAFAVIEEKFNAIKAEHGPESLAMYIGNATIGTTPFMLGYLMLLQSMGTPQLYTAGSLDHLPKLLTCKEMYGWEYTNPVPDIDRMDYLLMLGANPMVSNGSLWLATGFRTRVKKLQDRKGKLVVVDPRRTETAKVADSHHFIIPGRDPYFLLGLLHVLYRDGLNRAGPVEEYLNGFELIKPLADGVNLDSMAAACGIDTATIESIAHTLANTERAGVYGRVGSTTQEHGTLTSWLMEVVNIVAGNLDIEGGMMFPKAPAFSANTQGKPGIGVKDTSEPYRTRVRNMPAVCGELPTACLAEEIETPGKGQIKGLVTICGNPALSTPNSEHLDKALSKLDFLLCFDIYVNETTRHADVILPGAPTFEKSYYGAYSVNYAVRNVARYSPAIFPLGEGWMSDWDVLLQVSSIAAGGGVLDDQGLLAMENQVIGALISQAAADEYSVAYGVDQEEALAKLSSERGVDRLMDAGFRIGPYGDGFGKNPDGITLEKIVVHPEGLDLGALKPRLPEVLRTPEGKINVAPEAFLSQIEQLLKSPEVAPLANEFLLIGRRQSRSINTWGHNVNILAKGKFRCTLQINPADANKLGIAEGDDVRLNSSTGEIVAQAEITDDLMPGVVSLPHGWGHSKEGIRMHRAQQKPGVNINILMDENRLDAFTGNAVFNAIPVQLSLVG